MVVECVLTVLCALAPAFSSAAQVTLSWDPNIDPDLAGYKLYYGTSSGSYPFSVDVGNQTSYTLSGLLVGPIYYFAATAYNVVRSESGFSNEVSKVIALPVISSVSAFDISSAQATITWATNVASDSQVDYGLTTAYGSSTPLNSSLLTAHAVTLTGLLATIPYHYRVKSSDAAGNLAVSGDFTLTTLAGAVADLTPPAVAMTAPTAGATVSGSVTVAASATDNVGVVGVQFKLDGVSLGAELTAAPYTLSWTTTTTTNGDHTLTAVARDAAGNTATSAGVSVTVANGATTSGGGSAIGTGLVGYWALDDGTGTTAMDSSGNGNTGTLVNGPTWTAGKIQGALALDGLSQYVTIPGTAALNAYPLTVALWMKTSVTTGISGIVNKFASGPLNGYQVLMNEGKLTAWYFKDIANCVYDGGGGAFAVAGYNDNQWHHVVFVVDASGGTLYVDGVQKSTLPWTGTPTAASTTNPLSLGVYPGSAYFPGSLDDVRVYNRALSAAEVSTLYGGR